MSQTYAHRLLEVFQHSAHKPALRWKEADGWKTLTYAELREACFDLAASLWTRGIRPGDRVAIWLETVWQWLVADLALQLIGGITSTVYHTLTPPQAAAILRDCGARGLFSTGARLASLEPTGALDDTVRLAVSVDGNSGILFSRLLDEGHLARVKDPSAWEFLAHPTVQPEDLSAIIYTSGTTGEPKGVMLSHRNFLSNADGAIQCFAPKGGHTTLLHIPLAHVMARNTTVGTLLLSGGLLILAEPDRTRLPANLIETSPTIFVTVPYVLDKFMSRVREDVSHKGPLLRRLIQHAIDLGRTERLSAINGTKASPSPWRRLQLRVLDALVLRKIRSFLGGRIQSIVIGGANSNRESLEFFWGIGIPVYEGYGSTEVTNCATFTHPKDVRLGTVGHPAPRMEVRLADDGEVLVRGPNVMKGYWNRPEATREVLGEDGWFKMGDIGSFDSDNYLRILDRKKELFALSTGKKVAPQVVENALKLSPCVVNACTIGDRQRYLTALVIPDLDVIGKRMGLAGTPEIGHPSVREIVQSEIANSLKGLADFERVKRVLLLSDPFRVEEGLLTPTLKLRRKEIGKRYEQEIESLYHEHPNEDVLSIIGSANSS